MVDLTGLPSGAVAYVRSLRMGAMSTPVDIGTLITRSPEIGNNRPRIAGTGVRVRTIVGWYKYGLSPEEIASEMGLDFAQVYAALTYYHANREEIEEDIANEEAFYEEMARQHAPKRD